MDLGGEKLVGVDDHRVRRFLVVVGRVKQSGLEISSLLTDEVHELGSGPGELLLLLIGL